jgi:hypothetical protein
LSQVASSTGLSPAMTVYFTRSFFVLRFGGQRMSMNVSRSCDLKFLSRNRFGVGLSAASNAIRLFPVFDIDYLSPPRGCLLLDFYRNRKLAYFKEVARGVGKSNQSRRSKTDLMSHHPEFVFCECCKISARCCASIASNFHEGHFKSTGDFR